MQRSNVPTGFEFRDFNSSFVNELIRDNHRLLSLRTDVEKFSHRMMASWRETALGGLGKCL